MSMPQTRKPGRTHPRAVLLLLPLLLPYTSGAWAELSLADAERLALEADPAVIASQSRALALQEQAVADGQLPDPKLTVGVWNVPLDDFSMKKEGSSQFRSGIKQAFPRGQTLHYRQKHTEWLGRAEQAQTKFTEQEIRRDVRQTFLELYYQNRATQVIDRSRQLFKQLVDIARAHYASGRVSQQDVLQAQLELSRLEDRATKISAQSDVQRASLSRWIGEAAWQPVDPGFPGLPDLQSQATLKASLVQHPTIESATARVEAKQQLVKAAREQYKPGFDVGLEYRKRFGDNADGSDRPDMMAAMVTLDLPLFTEKRQDRRLAAHQQQAEAAIQTREQKLREMQRLLNSDYARWLRLGEQETLYQDHLLRESMENAEAALLSYQSGINEFNTLMRARITDLDVRLQALRIRVDRAKTQARLLFLHPPSVKSSLSLQGEVQ
ncbi:MAG: TolC family protein [Thiogranum sp.]